MSDPASQVEELRAQFERDLSAADREADVRAVRDRYLSRKGGLVSALLKALGSAPAGERPRLGRLANQLKQDIESSCVSRLAGSRRGARVQRAPSTSRCPDGVPASAIVIRSRFCASVSKPSSPATGSW